MHMTTIHRQNSKTLVESESKSVNSTIIGYGSVLILN